MVWDVLVSHGEILFVLILTGVALAAFATEAWPLEVTALSVLVLLAVSGVLTIDEALSGFANPATVTVLMMFVLSAAVTQSGFVDRLGERMGRHMGRSRARNIAAMGLAAGPVSAFMSTSAAVAVLIPPVLRHADRHEDSPSRLLIPLSFLAMLGGMATLVGTSSNLVASALREQAGLGRFGLFEFTPAALILLAVGVLYLATVGRLLLPDRPEAQRLGERYHLGEFLFEVEVPAKSPLVTQAAHRSELTSEHGADVLHVQRATRALDPRDRGVTLEPGDRVILVASRPELQRMAERGIVKLVTPAGRLERLADIGFLELLVTDTSTSKGKRIGRLRYWAHSRVHPVALRSRGEASPSRLYNRRLRVGDIVLVTGAKEDLDRLTGGEAFHVLGGPEPPVRRTHKVPHVLLVLVAVFGLTALAGFPIALTATAGAVLLVVTRTLRLTDMYAGIRWELILLLAGLLPLALALHTTGAARLLAMGIVGVAAPLHPFLLLTLFWLAASLLAALVSTNASVVLFVPVAIQTALLLGHDPIPFVLAPMFGAAASFLTPTGYYTNLMVMGPGGYRHLDYLRIGAPLSLLLAIVAPFVLNVFWPVSK